MIDYSPFKPEVLADPYPFYRRMRDEAPAYFIEEYEGWALTRFEDVWKASQDPQTFTTIHGTTAAQALSKVEAPVPSINQIDPPDHTRLRQALRPYFARSRVAAMEGAIRAAVRECLDAATGELDAVRDLLDPVAARVACHLLDLPEEAGPLLLGWVHRYTANAPGDQGRSSDGLAASMEMNEYLAGFAAEARKRPRRTAERVIDALLRIEIGGRHLEDLEISSHMMTLVIGGTDTTPKVLASAFDLLHAHPEQRASLVADPSGMPQAFHETMRYQAPTHFMARSVARDVELHGQKLREGQGVLLLFAAANRDEREFEDPDRFDIARRAPRILTLGHGPHVCIGAHIARLEGRIVLEELLSRHPDYDIHRPGIVRRQADQIHGIISLPLQLGASR